MQYNAPYPTLVLGIDDFGHQLIGQLLRNLVIHENIEQIHDILFVAQDLNRVMQENAFVGLHELPTFASFDSHDDWQNVRQVYQKALRQLMLKDRRALVGFRVFLVGDLRWKQENTITGDVAVWNQSKISGIMQKIVTLTEDILISNDTHLHPLINPVANSRIFVVAPCDSEEITLQEWKTYRKTPENLQQNDYVRTTSAIITASQHETRNYTSEELQQETIEVLKLVLIENSHEFQHTVLPSPGEASRWMMWVLKDGEELIKRQYDVACARTYAQFLLSRKCEDDLSNLIPDPAGDIMQRWGERIKVLDLSDENIGKTHNDIQNYRAEKYALSGKFDENGQETLRQFGMDTIDENITPENFSPLWTERVLKELTTGYNKQIKTPLQDIYHRIQLSVELDVDSWMKNLEGIHNTRSGVGILILRDLIRTRQSHLDDSRSEMQTSFLNYKKLLKQAFPIISSGEAYEKVERLRKKGQKVIGENPNTAVIKRIILPFTVICGMLLTPIFLRLGETFEEPFEGNQELTRAIAAQDIEGLFRLLASSFDAWWHLLFGIILMSFKEPVVSFVSATICSMWVAYATIRIVRKHAEQSRLAYFGPHGVLATNIVQLSRRLQGRFAKSHLHLEEKINEWLNTSLDRYRRDLMKYHQQFSHSMTALHWLLHEGLKNNYGLVLKNKNNDEIDTLSGQATITIEADVKPQWSISQGSNPCIATLLPPQKFVQQERYFSCPDPLWPAALNPRNKMSAEKHFLWPYNFLKLSATQSKWNSIPSEGLVEKVAWGPKAMPKQHRKFCIWGDQMFARLDKLYHSTFVPEDLPWHKDRLQDSSNATFLNNRIVILSISFRG